MNERYYSGLSQDELWGDHDEGPPPAEHEWYGHGSYHLIAEPTRIETVAVCQICLQPSVRSVCDGCESTGGLFGDWRSDCG